VTDDAPSCTRTSCRIATVLLVDARGWVLLQERDEHAPVAPDQWALVGGHVDPGEDWYDAMARELLEETGLDVGALPPLRLWFDEEVRHTPKIDPSLTDRWRVWVARADLTDDDIVLGEGRQIVFVDPARLRTGEVDVEPGAGAIVRRFLESDAYRALAG
jgi:8-oxo-dGTP pyrophosphatase MutT (NUDIX family)